MASPSLTRHRLPPGPTRGHYDNPLKYRPASRNAERRHSLAHPTGDRVLPHVSLQSQIHGMDSQRWGHGSVKRPVGIRCVYIYSPTIIEPEHEPTPCATCTAVASGRRSGPGVEHRVSQPFIRPINVNLSSYQRDHFVLST